MYIGMFVLMWFLPGCVLWGRVVHAQATKKPDACWDKEELFFWNGMAMAMICSWVTFVLSLCKPKGWSAGLWFAGVANCSLWFGIGVAYLGRYISEIGGGYDSPGNELERWLSGCGK